MSGMVFSNPSVALPVRVLSRFWFLLKGIAFGFYYSHDLRSYSATYQVNGHGIDSIAKFFMDYGYIPQDELTFPAKKLRALWFSPPKGYTAEDGNGVHGPLPRIFISELLVDQMTPKTQVLFLVAAFLIEQLIAYTFVLARYKFSTFTSVKCSPWQFDKEIKTSCCACMLLLMDKEFTLIYEDYICFISRIHFFH